MTRALFVFGTRPEAIKTAPVIRAMRGDARFEALVAVTAQHREMLDSALALFGIVPDHDLDLMRPGQTLEELTARILTGLGPVLDEVRPDIVLVQGDTTTTFTGALAALYRKIPVAHIEAGYRTRDRYLPFPEEANRRLVSEIATTHYAVNEQCRANLIEEGHAPGTIVVTGNTGIDALHLALESPAPAQVPRTAASRRILMTMHRRESWGEAIESACRAARTLIDVDPDLEIVFATHLNPVVRESAERVFAGSPRITLVPALDYASFAHLLDSADLVLSDSGGIHEEALSLAKPLLLLRNVTEWPDALASGAVRLVGTAEEVVVAETLAALARLRDGDGWPRYADPLADGRAAARIVDDLATRLGSGERA